MVADESDEISARRGAVRTHGPCACAWLTQEDDDDHGSACGFMIPRGMLSPFPCPSSSFLSYPPPSSPPVSYLSSRKLGLTTLQATWLGGTELVNQGILGDIIQQIFPNISILVHTSLPSPSAVLLHLFLLVILFLLCFIFSFAVLIHRDIITNSRGNSSLRSVATGRYVELDIWVPELHLCFEFQVLI